MKRSTSIKLPESAGFELGIIVGQQSAFSLVAGRCSAAEAAAIQRIRRERLYDASGLNWHEFCPRHLGMSRSQADRVIGYLQEFGPEFFELTQLSRISPDDYRAIAPAVKDGHIHWRNEAIALIPENREKVAAAVTGLRDAAKPSVPALPPPAAARSFAEAIATLQRRSDEVVAEWSKLVALRCAFPPPDRQAMKNSIGHTRQDLERLEHQVWSTPAGLR
jgi:hypothetical protein